MKVAFISRATLFSSPGGDTVQLESTAEGLRLLGVAVDIYLASDIIVYAQYDLLHFFNIIRPADVIKHIIKSRKPYVVSTIFVQYNTVNEHGKTSMVGRLKKILPEGKLEYLKTLARAIKNGEKINSWQYLFLGHNASVRYVAKHARILLPNSESEYKRFSAIYHLSCPYHVVPNGINKVLTSKAYPANAKYENAVLCMGRIESRKNQLALIRALNNTSYRLFIHGKPSPNNLAYYEQCKKEAASNVLIEGWLDANELYTAYSNAKVHVLASYFETTGLSSLEAAYMGCNIVVTDKGDTRDYFKDDAWYCDPDNEDSIREAVDAAYAAPYNPAFRERILRDFTWQRAAEETLKAYQEILKD